MHAFHKLFVSFLVQMTDVSLDAERNLKSVNLDLSSKFSLFLEVMFLLNFQKRYCSCVFLIFLVFNFSTQNWESRCMMIFPLSPYLLCIIHHLFHPADHPLLLSSFPEFTPSLFESRYADVWVRIIRLVKMITGVFACISSDPRPPDVVQSLILSFTTYGRGCPLSRQLVYIRLRGL